MAAVAMPLHRGEGPGLFYYRDRHGAEVDLVVSSGKSLTLVEVKAGATVAGDMLDAARKIRAALPAATPVTTYLVYGGDATQKRSDATILPWTAIQDRTW